MRYHGLKQVQGVGTLGRQVNHVVQDHHGMGGVDAPITDFFARR